MEFLIHDIEGLSIILSILCRLFDKYISASVELNFRVIGYMTRIILLNVSISLLTPPLTYKEHFKQSLAKWQICSSLKNVWKHWSNLEFGVHSISVSKLNSKYDVTTPSPLTMLSLTMRIYHGCYTAVIRRVILILNRTYSL